MPLRDCSSQGVSPLFWTFQWKIPVLSLLGHLAGPCWVAGRDRPCVRVFPFVAEALAELKVFYKYVSLQMKKFTKKP